MPRQQTWLITGASSGLGRALTEAALRRGDIVAAAARRTEALSDLARGWPQRLSCHRLDVTNATALEPAVAEVLAEHGRIDVLVNNAGRAHVGAVEETSDAVLRELMELHLFGPAALVRAVLPHMRERGSGTIVQMSSMAAAHVKTGFSAYSASKAALDAYSMILQAEVRQFGIDVLIVEPGSHRTSAFAPGILDTQPGMAEYAPLLADVRSYVSAANGNQPGDPGRAADLIIELVDTPQRPARLTLGIDAVFAIRQVLTARLAELDAWAETSARSARPDAPSAEELARRHSGGKGAQPDEGR
ncbi:MAG TPA: SDR family NAD(P)-dependent oxidoreductase [Dactylosporangium sp.]|jgi:NAD(P)-dependent dehydrogenase (short-subunit alcohol dehydrogenase family)|nr:SDR family NAD(P)-dependent oxidoreductase [Dactylosporangium sp.]